MASDILDSPEAGPAAIRGGALRVGGYAAGTLVSVVAAALVLRELGPARFGEYVAVFSLTTVVLGLAEAGTTGIGVREYATRRGEERRHVLADLQGLRIALVSAGMLGALAFSALAGYSDDQVLGTALAGAGLIPIVAAFTLTIPLQAELRLGSATLLELVRQVATAAALGALALGGAGVALLLGATVPAGLVLLAATLFVVRGRFPLRASFDRARWRRLLADSLPYAVATAVGVVYSYVAVIVMSLVAADVDVGLFGAAHRVFLVLAAVPQLLVGAAFPVLARAARDDRGRLGYAFQRIFELQLAFGVLLALGTAAAAPAAIEVIASDAYAEAVPALRLLAVALLGTSLIALGAYALLSLRRHRELLVVNLVAFATSVVLTAVLAPGAGAEGAAWATLAGEAVVVTGYGIALARAGLVPSVRLLPRVALAAAIGAVGFFALGLPAVPAALVGTVLYGAAALVLRAVPEEALSAFTAPLAALRGR